MTTSLSEPRVRPMFPHTVDSTILSAFRSCRQKFFRQYVEHWKPQSPSVHLIAGGAFAAGIESARNTYYVNGGTAEDAEASGLAALIRHYGDFQCPDDSAKSLERMCGALEFYFSHYPLGADGANPITLPSGRRGIEFSFAEPLEILHPVTGAPILYTGRSDMIAERAGGIYVYDEKTTSSLGATWPRQWEMRSQFTGYIWAAAQQGIKVDGAMVRGIAILKTMYNHMECPTYRTRYEVERWHDQTLRDIADMIRCWESGYWDYNLDGACTEYGGCSFVKICKSSDPEAFLPVYFEQRVWDPLLRKETSVADYEASWGHVRDASELPAAESKVLMASDNVQGLNEELRSMLK